MNKERLTMLADLCEERAVPKQFGMMRFFSNDSVSLEKPEVKCGTTACLAGWGMTFPELAAMGLRATTAGSDHQTVVPLFGGHEGFSALALFFDLEFEAVAYIFGEFADESDCYFPREKETLAEAVERVRRFIADGKCHWWTPAPRDVRVEVPVRGGCGDLYALEDEDFWIVKLDNGGRVRVHAADCRVL